MTNTANKAFLIHTAAFTLQQRQNVVSIRTYIVNPLKIGWLLFSLLTAGQSPQRGHGPDHSTPLRSAQRARARARAGAGAGAEAEAGAGARARAATGAAAGAPALRDRAPATLPSVPAPARQ